ncbi:GNAT family N-acetyltransferase [Jannaschia formosa]|uniref:GNAT family N-acetyltransferase n=1 Tax=Jannaschia formosa TaxID=2259592 RepID=UPI001ADD89B1|nr:GNAT family N-acetyltransferase [Jannaschia formosa]
MTIPTAIPLPPAAAARAAALRSAVPVLRTARCVLRAPELGDFDALHAILGSERGADMGGPFTREETWSDLCGQTATWLLRGHGMWTVEHAGAAAGFVLIGTEPGDREHELGWLLTAEHEGRGLAFEAASAARDHARGALALPSLVSYVAIGNRRSERLAERLGARADGTLYDGAVAVWRHWGTGS